MHVLKHWAQALLTPVPLLGVAHLPRYVADYLRFAAAGRPGEVRWRDTYPCLGDWTSHTPFDPHYLFQAAWLARKLAQHPPVMHVDIGSSVLTSTVVSAFVDTVFVDYRPLPVHARGFVPVAANITRLPFAPGTLESISCLHVLEHIGLGRYGDPLDPRGSEKAASELEGSLRAGGLLFLSTPVGRERVCFNAHRVFAPHSIVAMFPRLTLTEFSFVGDDRKFREGESLAAAQHNDYGCGMFAFTKAR
jgi:SAM-dependent methyltransferase